MFVSFGVTPISFPSFLGRIEDHVKANSGLAADLVFLSPATENHHLKCPPGDQFVALFPENMPVWQSVVSGAGSSFALEPGFENLGFDLQMKTVVFTRLNLDQEFRGSELFRNTTLGIMGVAGKIITCFQIWTAPTDADPAVSYLREPARVVQGPQMSHRDYETGLWSMLAMKFEMKFTLLLG